MIWVAGRIIPDEALTIGIDDRTFEHGLGLFETLRTWGGRPTLLDEHRKRMLRSAEALGIPVDPSSWPDLEAVDRLLEAEGIDGDRKLRITATGGTAEGRSVVWMKSGPLPERTRKGDAIICVNAWSLPSYSPLPGEEGGRPGGSDRPTVDFTTRHKTLNYWFKRAAFEQARNRGYDETLIHAEPWGFVEASRSNLFVVMGDTLVTPSTDAPILPGIMRALVLDVASEGLLEVQEVGSLELDQLQSATEVFLTNSVRGITPVGRIDSTGEPIDRAAPGRWTHWLQEVIARRLWPARGFAP